MKHIPKSLFWILSISFFVKLGYAIWVQFVNPSGIFLPDSLQYLAIAQNLQEHGAYSQSPWPDRLYPDSMRLPVYPLVMLFFSWASIPWFLLVILQILASTLSTWLVFQIAKKINLNKAGCLISAGLFAFDLPTLFFSNTLLTEVFFQLTVIGGIFLMLKGTSKNIILSALFFGIGLYLRPIMIFLPFLFGIYLGVSKNITTN